MSPSRSVLLLLALVGCKPDIGITKFNNDPVATITSHADGDVVDELYAFTLRGTVSDTNDAAADLTASWFAGSRELCAAAPLAADGSTTCDATLELGDDVVTLQGQDPDNAIGTDEVTLTVRETASPSATITAPTFEGTYYANEDVVVTALVSDGEDDPADLLIAWTDESGATLDIDAAADTDGILSGSLPLAAGDHSIRLTVTDSTGKSGGAAVEFTVRADNSSPTCAITAPVSGSTGALGETVDLVGEVTDVDVASDLLTASWESDLDGALGGGAVGADGSATLSLDTLSFGTHTLTLTGTDEVGATCTATTVFTVGTPPTIDIAAPTDGDLYNDDDTVTFLANVSDDATAADLLAIAWTDDVDGLIDTTGADATGVATFDAAGLSLGDHTVTLTVTDGDGLWTTATVAFTVNGLPGAPGVSITPASPGTDDDLVATIDSASVDPEGDPVTYAYAWTVDGAATAYTTATVPASATSRGETWEVTVTPNDGAGDGSPGSASASVGNGAPTLASVTLAPDPAYEGDTLTCAVGATSDPDGDTVSTSVAWDVNGALIPATTTTLGDTWWDAGDTVRCTVTPDDGTVSGTAVASNVVTIDDSTPAITAVAITPDPAAATDTLTCTASGFSDADGDADATTYEWFVAGVSVGTGPTLASGFGSGDTVTCTATPYDGTYTGTALSDSITVDNTPPVLASVSISPAAPTEADTLTCVPGLTTDTDGTTSFTYSYTWSVGGATLAATTATLEPAEFVHGDSIRCTATPNDGTDDGNTVASSAVTVEDSAPVVTAITLSPTSPLSTDTLTASVTTADLDGDAVTVAYAWYVNGGAVAATGTTLTSTYFDRGDTVYVSATPSDATLTGASVDSSAVTIGNALPSITRVTVSPTPAYVASTLRCTSAGYADADGDPDASTFVWTIGGTTVGTGSTLAGAFVSGDTVVCTVTPGDGTDTGTPLSDSVTIGNTAPVLAAVSLTPTTATEASTLTCTPGATTDADGTTAFTYTYAWTVDGAAVAPTSATLTAAYFDRGDDVVCTVTPNDGATSGTSVASNTVTISDTAPVISAVTLSSYTPATSDTLTATVTSSDADGDTVSYTYTWYVNGSAVAATGSTLSGATYFGHGDTVYVRVTPTDGTTAGAAVSSATATVANTAPTLTSVTITPDPGYAASTLTCGLTGFADADGDADASTYAWTVNGTAVGTAATLAGAFVYGDIVVCTVTPSDGTASGTARSDSLVISNTAPVLASVALTPTTATVASTLTCTPGSATDADGTTSFSYTYAWYVDGAAVAATTSTLSSAYFASADDVYCRVSVSDGTTAGTAVASNTVTIANTAPVLASVALTPTTASEASTLTCTPTASDADGDTITYAYAWYVNSAVISSTGSTLTGAAFSAGDTVYCRVTPSDSSSSGTAMSSSTVTIANTAPVLSAVSLTPSTAYEASTLTCSPTATDADGETPTYTYAWYVNSTAIAVSTATLTGTDFSSGDVVYCRVTPHDAATSGTAMSSSTVTISNTAPVISSVALTPTTASVASTFTCTPTATDADGNTVSYTYAWHVNATAVAATGSTLTSTWFSSGSSVYCRATPTDGTTAGTAVSSNTVTVSNTAPVLSSVLLTPTTAYEASTLTCTPTATDADGDTISYTYAWYVDSVAIAPTTSTLTGTYFSAGNTVYCRVTPSDSSTSGTAMSSSTVTISNTAPVLSAVSLTPTTAYEASTLTCAPTATDADGETPTYTYAWYVNSVVSAASTSTLTGTYFGSGDTVYCRVTPHDAATSGTAMSSSTVTISNSAPVISAVALTPTTAYEASTLTCTPTATDADGGSITYTYAWYVNSTAISQTSSTLTGTYFSSGNTVYCRVTPTDGTTAGTAVSSNTVTIANTVPVLSSVTLTPTTAYEASTLTCTPTATDGDGDTISYAYAWYVNSVLIAPTTSTLTGTYFSSGNTVYCRVTPSDSSASGTAMSSSTVTISNTVPVLSSVALTPTTAYEASTLTCTPTATDADGNTISYTYAWYVNSTLIAPTTATLTGTYFSSGNTVYCRVTPSDSSGSGTAVSSSTVTIANTAPVVSSVALTPTTAYEASTLTCTPTASDADGTSLTYTYNWYVNSALIAPTTSTLTGTYFAKTSTVYCTVTASDGTVSSSSVASSTVTISNTAPVVSAVALSPTLIYEASTVTCTPTSSDADGDSVSYTYSWHVNGTLISPTTSTLTGTYFSKSNTVYCTATPTDGTTAGTAVSSASYTVGNTAPTAPTVDISPTDPEAALDPIVCSILTASTDADSDTVTYTFTWTKNGSSYTGATSTSTTSTVPASATAATNVFVCTATPSDGTASGTAGTDSVTVLAASYTLGYATAFTTQGTGHTGGGYALAQQITVSSSVQLYSLGLYMRLASTGQGRMALYTNSGSAPGTLVAYTALANLPAGAVEVDVVGAPVSVSAGTYWIVENFSGVSTTFHDASYTTVSASGNTIAYNALSTGSSFPASFGSASTYTGQYMNLYMVVR